MRFHSISPERSTSHSNRYHCDQDGVYCFIETAMAQLAQVMEQETGDGIGRGPAEEGEFSFLLVVFPVGPC